MSFNTFGRVFRFSTWGESHGPAIGAVVDGFLRATKLVIPATSFGGVHTTADRRAQWGDSVPDGLVRLSCGIEDPADLVADIRAALSEG